MPQRKTGIKDLRQTRKRKLRNLDRKTDLKKTTKQFLASIDGKNASEAQTTLKALFKKLDKAAKVNLMQKNTVSRRKSRYSRLLASISK